MMMKKYKEFILEKLNVKDFTELYNGVAYELEKFWSNLEEKLEMEEFDKINSRSSKEVFEYNERVRNERNAKRQGNQTQPEPEKKEPQPEPEKKEPQPESKEVALDPKVVARLRRENSDKLVNYLYDSKYKDYYSEINKILNGRFLAYTTDQLLDKLRKPLYRDKVDDIKKILKQRQLKKIAK